jgi:hypothetical protein
VRPAHDKPAIESPLRRSFWPADSSVELDRRSVGQVLADWAGIAPERPAARWIGADGALQILAYRALDRAAEVTASGKIKKAEVRAMVAASDRS